MLTKSSREEDPLSASDPITQIDFEEQSTSNTYQAAYSKLSSSITASTTLDPTSGINDPRIYLVECLNGLGAEFVKGVVIGKCAGMEGVSAFLEEGRKAGLRF